MSGKDHAVILFYAHEVFLYLVCLIFAEEVLLGENVLEVMAC